MLPEGVDGTVSRHHHRNHEAVVDSLMLQLPFRATILSTSLAVPFVLLGITSNLLDLSEDAWNSDTKGTNRAEASDDAWFEEEKKMLEQVPKTKNKGQLKSKGV